MRTQPRPGPLPATCCPRARGSEPRVPTSASGRPGRGAQACGRPRCCLLRTDTRDARRRHGDHAAGRGGPEAGPGGHGRQRRVAGPPGTPRGKDRAVSASRLTQTQAQSRKMLNCPQVGPSATVPSPRSPLSWTTMLAHCVCDVLLGARGHTATSPTLRMGRLARGGSSRLPGGEPKAPPQRGPRAVTPLRTGQRGKRGKRAPSPRRSRRSVHR